MSDAFQQNAFHPKGPFQVMQNFRFFSKAVKGFKNDEPLQSCMISSDRQFSQQRQSQSFHDQVPGDSFGTDEKLFYLQLNGLRYTYYIIPEHLDNNSLAS